jgi:gliding motility-associated-like protein
MFRFYRLKIAIVLLISQLFLQNSKAQICNIDGNVIVYSNYGGGIINIDIDQNIPNLKVGICTYDAVEVNFIGLYVGNITEVIYAGYNSSGSCVAGVDSTIISGVDQSIVTIYSGTTGNSAFTTYLGNPLFLDGPPLVNCMTGGDGYCSDVTDNGGSNSAAQIVSFFLTEFGAGSLLYLHLSESGCFDNTAAVVSTGGNCCIEVPDADTNLIYTGGSTYNFLPDEIQLCGGSIVLDLTFYPVLYQPDIYTGYVWSDGITINPIFTVTEPGTYWFTVTDYCHTDPYFLTDTIVITACCEQPEPPLVNQLEPICFGEEPSLLTATAFADGVINWYADEELTVFIQESDTLTPSSILGTTLYYVTETLDSCESLPAIIAVTILDNPIVSITSIGSTSICEGESVTLESADAETYLWSDGTAMQSTSVTDEGYVSLTITENGCTGIDSILIEVNGFPIFDLGDDFSTCEQTATLQAPEGFIYFWSDFSTNSSLQIFESGTYSVEVSNGNCTATDQIDVIFGDLTNIDLGNDINTCIVPINLSVTDNNSYTYLWSTGETSSNINVVDAGFYSVLVQSGACIEEDSVEVSLGVLPEVSLGEDVVVCFQPSYELAVITAEENISWFDGTELTTTIINNSGVYWVSVTDANGCEAIDSINVDFAQEVELGVNQFICAGEKIYLDGGIGDKYFWNEELGTRFFEVNEPGNYFVQVVYGTCISSDSMKVNGSLVETNIYFPNAFTPNADGTNDLFGGIGDKENIVAYDLKIFSRWGELVFESYDFEKKWNGTYGSDFHATNGVYIFEVEFVTTCSFPEKIKTKGMLNLLR